MDEDFQVKLTQAVRDKYSYSDVLREIGWKINGTTHTRVKFWINTLNLDTSHFTGSRWSKGQTKETHESVARWGRRVPDEYIFQENSIVSRSTIKKRLLEKGVSYECSVCKNPGIWEGSNLTLDLDHVNGNPLDNRFENLRFLCPNCHRQTATFAGKKKGSLLPSNSKIDNREYSPEVTEIKTAAIVKNREISGYYTYDYRKDCSKCGAELKTRTKNGLCWACYGLKQRKVVRPPLETLLQELRESNFVQVGVKYNVSDNAVRKWLRSYGVDPKKVERSSLQYKK